MQQQQQNNLRYEKEEREKGRTATEKMQQKKPFRKRRS
jgi:hypothetical protein